MGAEADAIAYLNQRVHDLTEQVVGLREDIGALDETLQSAVAFAKSFKPSGLMAAAAARLAGR